MHLQLIKNINNDSNEALFDVSFTLAEVDMFNAWFARHTPTKVTIRINGNLYRFNSEQEKACFEYGLGHFYRESKINEEKVDKLKTEIKKSDNIIIGLFKKLKAPMINRLLN